MKHLASLIALLRDELVADGQQSGEAGLDNLVEMDSVIAVRRLESVGAADGEKTLQTSQNGGGIVRVQELHSVVHEVGPLLGEIEMQDALEDGDQLLPDQPLRGGHDGQQAVAEARLLIFGDLCVIRVVVRLFPSAIYAVLDIDNG